jgi:hypothetical protein
MVVIGIGLLSGLLWLGAIASPFFGYDPKPDDYLTDRTFPKAAEPICAATRKAIEKLPRAYESDTAQERAKVLQTSTDDLQAMITTLRGVVPDTSDAKYINIWLDDWEVHIKDRRNYVTRLESPSGDKEEFLESEQHGGHVSKSIDQYATTNKMESCKTPGDV